MAKFNDLAVELQEAIWELVLPQARGVHWVEVEGIPHEPDFVRDSIRMAQWHRFDCMPETHDSVYYARQRHPRFSERAKAKTDESGPFFRHLLTTVPAVFGRPGPDDDDDGSGQLPYDRDDEIAYTRRCRQLSTYTQISTLLSTCRLSRLVAQQRIRDDSNHSWPLHRSMGPFYRPRPMEVWEAQYGCDKAPTVITNCDGAEVLAPQIHALDLVVFRLHDSQGRATPLLRQAAWQYGVETPCHGTTFACLDRVGIEWHPSWGSSTAGGRGELLRPENVQAFVRVMQVAHFPSYLYWIVDGVPRPDWGRDYPAVVRDVFEERMAQEKAHVLEHLSRHWEQSDHERGLMLADHHLGQEFEANGRRYYIVFVAFSMFTRDLRRRLRMAGLGHHAPFPGGEDLWPEALRDPARLAYDVMRDNSSNMGTYQSTSYILSWEPI
ncbi:hypothetical protein SLS64_007894 [Diaporthe eres]|uniref:Uncharacterized protein n=1 Tax=Diaporthe eres TaxID=83184 RepID=A0ABR1PFC8_DIAER